MSKYTEARKCVERWTFINGNGFTNQDIKDIVCKALEIADRLEQAITDEQTADCIIVDAECVNNKQDKEVWLNGYSQALTDIGGDNK